MVKSNHTVRECVITAPVTQIWQHYWSTHHGREAEHLFRKPTCKLAKN